MYFTKHQPTKVTPQIEDGNPRKSNGLLKRFMSGFFSALTLVVLVLGSAFSAHAQCDITVIGSTCQNNAINFELSGTPSGATNYLWDFGDPDVPFSNDKDPQAIFPSGGTKTVKVTVKDANGGQLCEVTKVITVYKAPTAKLELESDSVQCFRGNKFCVKNLSYANEPGAKIVSSEMVFGDGGYCAKHTTLGHDPLEKCCHTVVDEDGGSFDITIRVVDDNGCIDEKTYKNVITVRPNLGLDFFTDAPVACGKTIATFTNNSRIPENEVKTWTWDFGDGTKKIDTAWDGLKHTYTGNGVFDASLVVTSDFNCTDTFEFKSAAENIVLGLDIKADKDSVCIEPDPEVQFDQKPVISNRPVQFLWDFGDPPSGPMNNDNESWAPSHRYVSLGPHSVTLIVKVGNVCLDTVYKDSIWIIGPQAKIEDPSYPIVIADSEKYQCEIVNEVNFTWASKFYHNGDTLFKDSAGMPTAYFMDYHIDRLWYFDDAYAPRCTTDTKANINVGMNCNWSKDRRPTHKYTDWETIYMDTFYAQNRTLTTSVFNKATRTCSVITVDTNQPALHNKLFWEQVPRCMSVKLTEKDTVHPFKCESSNTVNLALNRPDATGLTWEGRLCTGNDNPNNGVRFDMSGTKPGCTQYTTYVNFDTLQNPKVWVGPNAGLLAGILPSPDGNPWAASPPATRPNFFLKKYGINDVFDKKTGWVSVGLMVGNGVPSGGGQPATCMDTFYYDSLFRIIPINATYNIINDTFAPLAPADMHFCKGDVVTTAINFPYQDSISTLTWDWNDGYRTQELRYRYVKDPNNPNQLINYLLEREIDPNSNVTVTDSIVTRVVTSWDTVADVSLAKSILESRFEQLGFYMREIDPADIPLYFGGGSCGGPNVGCIDTCGFGNLITYGIRPKTSYGTHYRDTMIGAFDTVHVPERVVDNGDGTTTTIPAHIQPTASHQYNTAGQYIQSLSLRSTLGCQDRRGYIVLIGFHSDIQAENIPVCVGTSVEFSQFIRYYSFKPITDGLYDPEKYWDDPARSLAQLETLKWDFDKNDDDPSNPVTIFGESGPNQTHIYNQAGEYEVRIALKDSNDCRDTVTTKVYVTDIDAEFGFNDLTPAGGCVNIIQFLDKSSVNDPCMAALGTPCDQIDSFWWDFGDPVSGKENTSRLQNPGHNYRGFGEFEVTLVIQSKLGCRDTFKQKLYFDGPNPSFTHSTLQICAGQQITLVNTSENPDTSAKWLWNWGDGSSNASVYSDYPTDTQVHVYNNPGSYNVTVTETQTFFLPSGAPYQCKIGYPYMDSIVVTVLPVRESDFEMSDTLVCPNDVVTFTDMSDTIYTDWVWDFGDGSPQASGEVVTHFYTEPGTYTVTLSPSYVDPRPFHPECPTTISKTIVVETVVADFTINSGDKPFFTFTNTSQGAVQYRWTFLNAEEAPDTEDPSLYPKLVSFEETPCEGSRSDQQGLICTGRGLNLIQYQGEFWVCLEATNANGCKDTTCRLLQQDLKTVIKPHNVFTPGNQDGANDVFEIEIEGEEVYDLVIYNRWGVKIFESTSKDYDWNGKIMNTGADCPEGTYFWTLNYRLKGGDDDQMSGTVTLIR